MKKVLSFILAAVMIFCLASCKSAKSNTSITVCLDWTPNTNHTGMFVALAKDYYKDAGLDVKIVQPPENGATQACAAGQAQFAVDMQDTLAPAFTADTPLGVTAVAAIIQHNTSGIMSKKGEGMSRPAGLTGKTYLTWDSPTEKAIIENVVTSDGGDWSQVKLIPNTVTDEAQDVLHNPDQAIWIYYAWSGINAQVSGVDIDYFSFKDINPVFDYYTPVIIANNEFLSSNPDEAKKFLEATKKGYEFAIENPEEAAQILIDSDDTGSLKGSEKLVTESQKYLADKYIADAEKWGYIDAARWDAFYKWLYDSNLVEKEIPAGTGFTNDYLQ